MNYNTVYATKPFCGVDIPDPNNFDDLKLGDRLTVLENKIGHNLEFVHILTDKLSPILCRLKEESSACIKDAPPNMSLSEYERFIGAQNSRLEHINDKMNRLINDIRI